MKKSLPDVDPNPVCERLVQLREALGFKKAAGFTRKIDMPYSTYKNFETVRMPPPEILIRIKEKLPQSNIEWVLTGAGSPLWSNDGKMTRDYEVEDKPDQGQAVRMLLDIFESGDQKAVEAIYKVIEYISGAVKRSQADRRKVVDPNWPAENERRKGAAGPKSPQGQ